MKRKAIVSVSYTHLLGMIRESIKEHCPNASFFIPEHQKWYRFGLGIWEA